MKVILDLPFIPTFISRVHQPVEITLKLIKKVFTKLTKFVICLKGFATRDEFDGMNSLGLRDVLYATSLSHPLHRARLSEQTWVNQRALRDPVLDKIIER